jgi:hypothetical protein
MHDNNLDRVYPLLKYTFGLVPIVAGLDKFTNLLADWPGYVSPAAANILPVSPEVLMMIVGLVEIAVGALILSRFTRQGAYIAAAWLALIGLNLVIAGQFDIAVRDFVMAIAAFSLGELAKAREQPLELSPARRGLQPAHV